MGGDVSPINSELLSVKPMATVIMETPSRLSILASGMVSKWLMLDSPSVTMTTTFGTSGNRKLN